MLTDTNEVYNGVHTYITVVVGLSIDYLAKRDRVSVRAFGELHLGVSQCISFAVPHSDMLRNIEAEDASFSLRLLAY